MNDILYHNEKNNFTVFVTPRAGVHTAGGLMEVLKRDLGGEYTGLPPHQRLVSEPAMEGCDINIKLVRNPYLRAVSSYRWFFNLGHLVGLDGKNKVSFEGYLAFLLENNLNEVNHHFGPQTNGEGINRKSDVVKNDDIENVKKCVTDIFRERRGVEINLDDLLPGNYTPPSEISPSEYIGNLNMDKIKEKYTFGVDKKWFYNDTNRKMVEELFRDDLTIFGYDWCFKETSI